MLLFVENKCILAEPTARRWGWVLHNAEQARKKRTRKTEGKLERKRETETFPILPYCFFSSNEKEVSVG